jgi:nitrate reductase NapA
LIRARRGYHAVLQNQLSGRQINAYWVMVNNNVQAAPADARKATSYRNPSNFIVVSRSIRPSRGRSRPHPAGGDGSRREGRTETPAAALLAPASTARRGTVDLWRPRSSRSVSRSRGLAEGLIAKPAARQTLYEVLFGTVEVDRFPLSDMEAGCITPRRAASKLLRAEGLVREYAQFGRGHGTAPASFDTYHQTRGLRWPVVNGKETLWPGAKEAPTVRQTGTASSSTNAAARR